MALDMKRKIRVLPFLLGLVFVSCTHRGALPPKSSAEVVEVVEPWTGKAITTGGILAALRGEGAATMMTVSCAPWPEGRKERTPRAIQPNASGWYIHAQGVGELSPGKEIPESALKIEGKSRAEFFDDGFAEASEDEFLRGGFVDQDGLRIMRFSKLDLQAKVTLKNTIFALYPGESIRTIEGTGVGSTLRELEAAYGEVSMSILPEPYECGVYIPKYPNLAFLFRNCDSACGSQGASKVHVGGYDSDESELPWGYIETESPLKED